MRSPPCDTEDHELGWTQRRYTNRQYQPAIIEIILCHCSAVVANEEALLYLANNSRVTAFT
ncbi:MAG TPA: hypothetical protein VK639_09395 [Terriglobales bacterium]|nr:hypothetical protein [Terriglobales bacterium]